MAVIKLMVYITCFCLYQDLIFCDDYGESGNEITLTPSIRGKPEEILWTHNGNKVLEYDRSEVLQYGSFKDRVNVDFETGQLTIRKLNSQDSGIYQSEIWINGKVQIASHTLTVLDALPEPWVTCELNETSNLKKLSCSVESQTQPSYEWSGPDIKQQGPTILVDEQEEKRDSVYTCTVKNKAASRTTHFTLQDCHTAGGVSPTVLVPVIIVIVLLFILLAVLVLYLYRQKKQKAGESEQEKMDPENGECDHLINVPKEAMPGSPDATLPCHTRLTAPKESIADKKWDQDSGSENVGETHEGQQLLKASPQSAITEKNKEGTGNTNEKKGENADEAEENVNSEQDETDRNIESQKSSQTQEEMEIMKNESENEEESPEKQTETLGDQETEDADKNEEDQTPGEKMEEDEENKEIDGLNTGKKQIICLSKNGECDNLLKNAPTEAMPGSPDATHLCRTRPTAPKESIADKKWNQDSKSENAGETHEGQKLLKASLQSTITEKNKEGTGNTNEKKGENADEAEENVNSEQDETDRNIESQKSSQTQEEMEIMKNESENEEESPEKQTETLGDQETEDADKNEEDQTPGEKMEEDEENKEIDRLNTGKKQIICVSKNGECDNLLKNAPTEAMPGSPDATHLCRTRPTAPKESIADKKWNQDSKSENAGETHEGQKLLKASLQSTITEKNKEGTGNTNEKKGENADEAEENVNSEQDETDRNIESQKSSQTQEEMEIMKNESENEEESPEKQTETLGDQETEDADKNEEDQTPGEKMEEDEENKEIDRLNTGKKQIICVSKNGECDNLLKNAPTEAMPGSPDATHLCRTRPTAPKESIADKKWNQDSKSENAGETHEGQKLLKASLQSTITEKNKEGTGNTNEKKGENADEAEENVNSEQDETDRNIESQKSSQTQEEMEIMKNESENEEESPEKQTETLGDQETEDADKNEEDQTPGEKMEEDEENKEIDRLNTGKKQIICLSKNGECDNLLKNAPTEAMPGSPDATLPCRTGLTAPKESVADKKWDHDSESENLCETHEGQTLLKASPQSAITEKKEDPGELDKNEKNCKNADETEENANSKPGETDRETESQKSLQTPEEMEKEKSQMLKNESKNEVNSTEKQTETLGDQKTEDAEKNEDGQTPEDKKEKKDENEDMGSPNTGSSDATLPCRTRNKETDSPNTETVSPERSTVDTGNVEELLHTNENNSQNENGEQSPE